MEHASSTGLSDKGLRADSLGLAGAVAIGVSSVAPAYTLTGALGPAVSAVGTQVPAVFLLGFLPMLLVTLGYRELNRALPDSGTSFTWTTHAFGPWTGWMAGWGLIAATVLVLSNLAAISVQFFYLLLGELTGHAALAQLYRQPWIDVASFLSFTGIAAWLSQRELRLAKSVQTLLTLFQIGALLLFAALALWRLYHGQAHHPLALTPAWLNPWAVAGIGPLAAGLSLSIFIYWGWDVVLTLAEETRDSAVTPGRAATLTMVAIAMLYLLLAAAAIGYAGVGTVGLGLGNPAIQDNIFSALAYPVLGPLAPLMAAAVLLSSLASLQATFSAPARTLLAMAQAEALPSWLGQVHPRFHTPMRATLLIAGASAVFYVAARLGSGAALRDTISALGMLICFYYGLTAFAATWYFRASWFQSPRHCFLRLLCPMLGGSVLAALFAVTAIDSMDPGYGSGAQLAGIGLVFWLGVGMLGLGALLMCWQYRRAPAFFRRPPTPAHGIESRE